MPDGAPWTPTRSSHAHFPGVPVCPQIGPQHPWPVPMAPAQGRSGKTGFAPLGWVEKTAGARVGSSLTDCLATTKAEPKTLCGAGWRETKKLQVRYGRLSVLCTANDTPTTATFGNVGGPKMDFMMLGIASTIVSRLWLVVVSRLWWTA
ncbi:hypothetical protein CTAM01_09365 [Colletotrichum tamarilloi]|uniref:Uncharacterized protein n=1 Tax=Colletotrichum tamarilloi TaxID=1209934 RepID=A0ABQ9R3Q6_9PEZI|nr:uncharacterized protein CTAM01_09365 [Colletotrichum tamarilloi]KAK1493904.1 hypothetical protein CTAM01_09365 [Colletotrichum tamarilloi]